SVAPVVPLESSPWVSSASASRVVASAVLVDAWVVVVSPPVVSAPDVDALAVPEDVVLVASAVEASADASPPSDASASPLVSVGVHAAKGSASPKRHDDGQVRMVLGKYRATDSGAHGLVDSAGGSVTSTR